MQLKHVVTGAMLCVSVMLAGCGGNSGAASARAEAKFTPHQKVEAPEYGSVVQELYIAYYGRPADPAGLASFEAELAAADAPTDIASLVEAYGSNPTVKALIDSFGNSQESANLYGNNSTSDFVTAIFQSVLGRAPASAGLAYWTNAIDNAGLSKGDAAASIMVGGLSNTTAQGLQDRQAILNKVAVAGTFTSQVSLAPGLYAGQSAAATARYLLTQVTSTTDMGTFLPTIDSTISKIALDENPGLAADNVASLTLTSTTSLNAYVTQGAFDGNLGNCSNTFLPGCGFTPVGATCGYAPATATSAAYIAAVGISYEDASGNSFGMNLYSPNNGAAPFTVGETLSTASETVSSYFLNSHGEFIGDENGITVTAVSLTGMSLTIKNQTFSGYVGPGEGTYGTEIISGTFKFTCDPGKSVTL